MIRPGRIMDSFSQKSHFPADDLPSWNAFISSADLSPPNRRSPSVRRRGCPVFTEWRTDTVDPLTGGQLAQAGVSHAHVQAQQAW